MTLIYIHHDQRSNCIELFSDSVVSAQGCQITDIFPKINILNIRSRSGNHGGFVQDTQLGFAFAGSTLSAQAVFTSAAAFLQNLAASNNATLSVEDACNLVAKIALIQISKIAELKQKPEDAFAKIVITGFCPVANRVTAHMITPTLTDGNFEISVGEVAPCNAPSPSEKNVFGSAPAEFFDYAKAHEDLGPFELFSGFLKQCKRQDVGGYVQYGVAHALGFEICPIVEVAQRDGDRVISGFRQMAGIGLDTENLISNPAHEEDRIVIGRLFRGSLPQ